MKIGNDRIQTTDGRILARVLAEDLRQVHGGDYPLQKEVKSTSCGTNCDEIVTDSAALADA